MFRFFLLCLITFTCLAVGVQYSCPMHCEGKKTYEKEGICPVCKMYLTKEAEGEESSPLNLRDYRVDLRFDFTDKPSTNELAVTLTPRLTADNSVLKDLDSREGKEVEVYLTNQDLTSMDHIYPTKSADGSFVFKKEFEKSENALLFVMLKPKNAKEQVFPLAMKVELPKGKEKKKNAAKIKRKNVEHAYLVIVSEDTTYFSRKHIHTSEFKKNKSFQWLTKDLPKPGLYKVFVDDGQERLSFFTVKK